MSDGLILSTELGKRDETAVGIEKPLPMHQMHRLLCCGVHNVTGLAGCRPGSIADFGYEVSLMRKYQKLAAGGANWLIVYAPDDAATQRVADLVKPHGAILAEKYDHLSVEDLL